MKTLYLCTDATDRSALLRLLDQRSPESSDPIHGRHQCEVIPKRPAAAAAKTGALIERLTTSKDSGSEETGPVVVTLVVRVPGLSEVHRILRADTGDDHWFADGVVPQDAPLIERTATCDAWAFAAACALLPPHAVLGFAGGESTKDLVEVSIESTNNLVDTLTRSKRRYSPAHVTEAGVRAEELAGRARLTVTQRALLIRAAKEAAVRSGGLPPVPEQLPRSGSDKAAQNRAVNTLVSELEEIARAKA